jgi:hypothetical protein
MKPRGILLLGVLIMLALPGCNLAERYQQNNAATAQWINANAGIPAINISGKWHSGDWGDAVLMQKGNRITGYIGKYPVGGSVKGNAAFLALTEDGWTYYTAVVELTWQKNLEGSYSDSVPFAPEDRNPFQLLRTGS